ncbi:MAG TPA: hypothetical protein VGG16_29565 [Streptosporangiaceae bacterium]
MTDSTSLPSQPPPGTRPLRAIPLRAIPLKAIPLKAIPLREYLHAAIFTAAAIGWPAWRHSTDSAGTRARRH